MSSKIMPQFSTSSRSRKSRGHTKTKSQLQDDSIMGTNNSSIVSKRSVERLYFPDDLHFFQYFVNKPQRRSPSINRGYWLRMKAVERVVRQFLETPSVKKKAVVNLGCGYDPLPWQILTRYPSASKDVTFVDIDYVDLIRKKREVVMATDQLISMFTNIEISEGDILLRSDEYVQIGCDLRDLVGLQRSLASAIEVENTRILFIAEISIAYMNTSYADALIEWAGRVPDVKFCLLEQLLPKGVQHPFAMTMMAHFDNIQTPLRPARQYPTTSTQKSRFNNLGWPEVVALNLWELWGSADFLTSDERKFLDSIEPFDEWEEFALFGCHYVLLVAETSSIQPTPLVTMLRNATEKVNDIPDAEESLRFETNYAAYPKGHGFNRFASVLSIRGLGPSQETFGSFGGMGLTTRVNCIDVYGNEENVPFEFEYPTSSLTPASRMCHTTTDLGDSGTLLVGGRNSPDAGLADCWLYHKWSGAWERIPDLPSPRYRHQAVYLGHGYVLVSPGRSTSKVMSQDYLVWHRQTGWLTCGLESMVTPPAASYGHVFCVNAQISMNEPEPRTGILAGGISGDGIMQNSVWHWQITGLVDKQPVMHFSHMDELNKQFPLSRFGAASTHHDGSNYIAGGIIQNRLLESHEEIFRISYQDGKYSILPVILQHAENETAHPLLIGTTLVSTLDSLVIMGGSAVCYSFGTFWNKGCYTISVAGKSKPATDISNQQTRHGNGKWRYMHTILA